MIEIYLKSNTNYETNGDITLDPISCTYKDSENLLTLEHPFDEEGRYKYISYENIIAAEENNIKKLYRIYEVEKSLYSIIAYARPIFYDLADKVLLDVRPTNKLGQEALNILLEDTGFTGHSNLSTLSTSYYVRKNIVEALLNDDENSFLNRWGGEFYCENFDIYINDRIGTDRGVGVSFGLNLNEIEEVVNIEEVVTRIIPVGFNGIMLDSPNPWVDSPLIDKYTKPKMRVIEFDVKVKENIEDEEGFNTLEEARAELIRLSNLLFKNGIDSPSVNYKIDMINLANTTAYKDYKMLVEVNKGDTVTCYVEHLDIDVKARVIDYERDLLTGEYISLELGNVVNNFFNRQTDITDRMNNILNNIDLKLNEVITSGGAIRAEKIQGFINGTKAKLKVSRDIAQKQEERVIEFEDLDPESPTYGSTILGTQGMFVADTKDIDGNWIYESALTARGLVANMLYGNILAGNGTYFDLQKGEIYFKKGLIEGSNSSWNLDTGVFESKQADGSKITISPSEGFYYLATDGGKREYHNLAYTISTKAPINQGDLEITLPKEFEGKNFNVMRTVDFLEKNEVLGSEWALTNVGVPVSWNGLKIYPASNYEFTNIETGERKIVPAHVTLTIIA